MSQEIWRPVVSATYGNDYEVSSLGRVRRTTDGPGKARAGNILTPRQNKSGHRRVALCSPYKNFMVHRLVLEAFVGPQPEGMECCHNDSDPANNRLENLRWDTRSANHFDRPNRGVKIRGAGNGRAKIAPEIARGIRVDDRRSQDIADEYGIHQSTVLRIKRGQTWAEA